MDYKIFAAALFLIPVSLGPPAHAQTQASSQASQFVQEASVGNEFEIESSELAVQRTTAQGVKDFAQEMVTDHTKAKEQLEQTLASPAVNMELPEKALDEKHQKIMDDLNAASAQNFDDLYIQAQTDAHDEAVTLFKDYAQNGDNAALKKFASDTLPTLEKHHEEISRMNRTQ